MQIKLNSWTTNRYALIDADGEAQLLGYDQRPAAMRHAERSGMGVYDTREGKLIKTIDVDKRLTQLSEHVDHCTQELKDAEAKLSNAMGKADEARKLVVT